MSKKPKKTKYQPVIAAQSYPETGRHDYMTPTKEYHDREALRLAYWRAVSTKHAGYISVALAAWACHLRVPRLASLMDRKS